MLFYINSGSPASTDRENEFKYQEKPQKNKLFPLVAQGITIERRNSVGNICI